MCNCNFSRKRFTNREPFIVTPAGKRYNAAVPSTNIARQIIWVGGVLYCGHSISIFFLKSFRSFCPLGLFVLSFPLGLFVNMSFLYHESLKSRCIRKHHLTPIYSSPRFIFFCKCQTLHFHLGVKQAFRAGLYNFRSNWSQKRLKIVFKLTSVPLYTLTQIGLDFLARTSGRTSYYPFHHVIISGGTFSWPIPSFSVFIISILHKIYFCCMNCCFAAMQFSNHAF